MELQFLGHSCFLLHDGTSKVLTDPFLTGNAFFHFPGRFVSKSECKDIPGIIIVFE